ncbi:hypothetical protein [Novipirellula caenicola]|uniref:HEAT repeat protein n=1 Tax=Novipirellula caenicola TaxID=1536901 RepID=A0ABP9VW73_9BACT
MNPTESLDALEADNGDALYRCRHDAEHRHSVLALLKELLTNPDVKVLHRGMNAAGRIRGAFDETDALAELVPLVAKHVSSDDELIRRVAIGALHCIGSHDTECSVLALIRACDDETLLDAALLALVDLANGSTTAIRCFHRFASHSKGKIRRIAIRGLGTSNATDDATIAVITAATNDRNQSVREMARKVLAKIEAQA